MAANLDRPQKIILIQEPGPFNLMFSTQFERTPKISLNGPQFKWASNNNIDPGGPGPLQLMLANQFKWVRYNDF